MYKSLTLHIFLLYFINNNSFLGKNLILIIFEYVSIFSLKNLLIILKLTNSFLDKYFNILLIGSCGKSNIKG